MVYSNSRKLGLSGWLQKNNNEAYSSPLRLQKFLFFYEVFSKIAEDESDFSRLKGYKRGPVFSTVWGDYTKDREQFNKQSLESYNAAPHNINSDRASRASFIVSSLSENELSMLTHKFNIWNSKSNRIMAGEQQVELSESDFNSDDNCLAHMLEAIYTDALVQDSVIFRIGENSFVFSSDDSVKITELHIDTLVALAEQIELHNPVFVKIDENGGLIVD